MRIVALFELRSRGAHDRAVFKTLCQDKNQPCHPPRYCVHFQSLGDFNLASTLCEDGFKDRERTVCQTTRNTITLIRTAHQ